MSSSISVLFWFSRTATRFSRHFTYSFFFRRHSRAASLKMSTYIWNRSQAGKLWNEDWWLATTQYTDIVVSTHAIYHICENCWEVWLAIVYIQCTIWSCFAKQNIMTIIILNIFWNIRWNTTVPGGSHAWRCSRQRWVTGDFKDKTLKWWGGGRLWHYNDLCLMNQDTIVSCDQGVYHGFSFSFLIVSLNCNMLIVDYCMF